jgi:hypothetical protein
MACVSLETRPMDLLNSFDPVERQSRIATPPYRLWMTSLVDKNRQHSEAECSRDRARNTLTGGIKLRPDPRVSCGYWVDARLLQPGD